MIELIKKPPIAIVFLNRPEVLNALSDALVEALVAALEKLDRDDSIGTIVLAGKGKAFAAGADIREMVDETEENIKKKDRFAKWGRFGKIKKPIIAAVHGYALGGGCELALACDIIIASQDAQFGQPEVLLGIIPGAGGTQRLMHTIGKHKTMELILTGRRVNAQEAKELGFVNKIVPQDMLLQEAEALAMEIAKKPRLAVLKAKEAILKAASLPLDEGLAAERQLFYSLFSTEDQKEGMRAFLEKREPKFKNQ